MHTMSLCPRTIIERRADGPEHDRGIWFRTQWGIQLQNVLMEDVRTRRSCMSSTVTMSMKDAPYRLKSKALGQYIVLGR